MHCPIVAFIIPLISFYFEIAFYSIDLVSTLSYLIKNGLMWVEIPCIVAQSGKQNVIR